MLLPTTQGGDPSESVFTWAPSDDDFVTALSAVLASSSSSSSSSLKGGLRSLRIHLPAGSVIVLGEESITLSQNSMRLAIVGLGEGCRLVGSGYCLFHVRGRKTRLSLTNLVMHHTCVRTDKREIGACVFGLAQSTCELHGCALTSEAGFAAWVVQRATLTLTECKITSIRRSGLVAFGDAVVSVADSNVVGNFIHGICSRGRVRLRVENTLFESNGVRALYAYQACSLLLKGCVVRGTRDPTHSAVSVFHCQGVSQPLYITSCRFADNAGAALTIAGVTASVLRGNIADCLLLCADGSEEPLKPIFSDASLAVEKEREEEEGKRKGEGGETCH